MAMPWRGFLFALSGVSGDAGGGSTGSPARGQRGGAWSGVGWSGPVEVGDDRRFCAIFVGKVAIGRISKRKCVYRSVSARLSSRAKSIFGPSGNCFPPGWAPGRAAETRDAAAPAFCAQMSVNTGVERPIPVLYRVCGRGGRREFRRLRGQKMWPNLLSPGGNR